MSTNLTTTMAFDFAAKFVEALDLQTKSAPASLRRSYSWSNGTAKDKADIIWTDTRTIAASGSDDLDLTASLTDAFGTSLTFARLKAIIIAAAAGNTNNVNVGGDTAAAVGFVADASDIVVVRPGGLLVWIAPDATAAAVTSTTADVLQIANSSSGSSVTYDIILIGASA